MITAYHRPQSLDKALELLSHPNTFPLGGGTLLSHRQSDAVEVVDLQALGLNSLKKSGKDLEIGATATLQQLLEDSNCLVALKSALKLEAPLNLRNAGTVAGTIVVCDGRSTFTTTLLALDAKLTILNPQSKTENLGDFLPLRPRGLITSITIPLNVKVAFEYVARTPADKPIVCVALAQWPSGRTRLAVGGYGKAPMLAMDGTEAEGIEAAARNAFHEAQDEWASAEYRQDVAATLAKRCL
ncbi:MAG: FAD binding domain-containing protein [Chloroflexi bacterium]|nr:FAD binding domain-containing protein [Chloroflexota bacterium]